MLLRIANMRGVDLSVFDVDYDLTWNAIFLRPSGEALGRFGGRDAADSQKYLTIPALKASMQAALDRYRRDKPGPAPGKAVLAEDYPGAAKWPVDSCIHCHHVYELRRDQMQRDKRWSLDQVWVYPEPENIGLSLDPEQGNRVLSVLPDSPAAKAGIAADDVLRSIGAAPIASAADVQYALHQGTKAGELSIAWRTGKDHKKAILQLGEGWRKTDVSWRWSLKTMSPNPSIIGSDLDDEARKRFALDPRQLAFRQTAFLTPAARHAGLQTNDIIVGIDGKRLMMNAYQFEAHIRLNYHVGQEVAFDVLRGKGEVKVKLRLPE